MDQVFLDNFSTTAGYLQHAPVTFSRQLTCVIGARGTCKSTLVESIRYCLNSGQGRARILEGDKQAPSTSAVFGLIKTTLGAGTTRSSIWQKDGAGESQFSVEREFESEPRIYRDDVREHANQDILKCFEIYSQGDLQAMADGEQDRLVLIDRPNAITIDRLRRERNVAGESLGRIGDRLKTVRAQILKLDRELRNAPGLQQQLDEIQKSRPRLSEELESSRASHLLRKTILSVLDEALVVQDAAVSHLQGTLEINTHLVPLLERLEGIAAPELTSILTTLKSISEVLEQAASFSTRLPDFALAQAIASLAKTYDEKDDQYYHLQKQQNEVNDALKREDHLRRQIDHMERLRAEIENLRIEEQNMLVERQKQRTSIIMLSETIFELRIEQVDKINDKHGDLVLLSLQAGSQSDAYIGSLSDMLAGSRIREQREVAEDMAKRVTPSDLVDIVESGDARELADIMDRDLGQMTRVISHLSDHERLYDLEAQVAEDRLGITLFDAGIAKPIESLSKGQKATALLPLILRPSKNPLIIDQPEDDLDNSFIYRSLITTIRELKHQRQIVFVTHNANIPVLGEAEQVVVMNMKTPVVADAPLVGTVEERKQEILDLLEGGAKAFEERHKRYAQLLVDDVTHAQ